MNVSFKGVKNTGAYYHIQKEAVAVERNNNKYILPKGKYFNMHTELTNINGKDRDEFNEVLKAFPNQYNPNTLNISYEEFVNPNNGEKMKIYAVNDNIIDINKITFSVFNKIFKLMQKIQKMPDEELKTEIQGKANDYMNLVYTADQVKDAKKDRANLNKFVEALESKRKEIKKQITEPYSAFEKQEKELIGIVNKAITNIDTQIKGYEEATRQEKLEKVKEIYAKTIGGLADVVTFDKIFKESWLNVSTTFKSITKEITEIRDKVDNDLFVINADTSSFAYEMKEEYLKNFDLTAAINKKQKLEETAKQKAIYEEQLKEEEEQRKQRSQEEAKKVVFAGKSTEKPVKAQKPVNTEEKISTITFRCTVKEHNFKEVNARLSLVQKVCEEFKIIDPKEEL